MNTAPTMWELEISTINEFGRIVDTELIVYGGKTSAEAANAIKEELLARPGKKHYQVVATEIADKNIEGTPTYVRGEGWFSLKV